MLLTGNEFGAVSPLAPDLDGAGATVAIIDTGIKKNNCYLTGRIAGAMSKEGGDGNDATGHGSGMATTCCGSAAGGGVARGAKVYDIDVASNTGAIADTVNLSDLLGTAKTAGASVVLLAFGARAKW